MKKGIITAIVGSVLLIAVSIPVGYAIRYYTAPTLGKIEVQVQTHDAAYMMSAYNYFFAANEQIKAYDVMLDAQKMLLFSCSVDYKDTVLTNIAGIKGQRAQAIAEYNAKSKAEWTTGQFRDWELPYQIAQEEN